MSFDEIRERDPIPNWDTAKDHPQGEDPREPFDLGEDCGEKRGFTIGFPKPLDYRPDPCLCNACRGKRRRSS